jgi:hypothetical protein
MIVGNGTVPVAAQSFSGNICFEFSVLCLCSALHTVAQEKYLINGVIR